MVNVTNHPLIGQRVRLTGSGWTDAELDASYRIIEVDTSDSTVLASVPFSGPTRLKLNVWVWIDDPNHPFAGELVRTIYDSQPRNVDPLPWVDGHTDAAGNPRRFAEPYHVDGDGTDCQWCITRYAPRPEYDAQPPIHPVNPILTVLREGFAADARPGWVERVFDNANGVAWDRAGNPDDGAGSQWDAFERHAMRVIERLAAL